MSIDRNVLANSANRGLFEKIVSYYNSHIPKIQKRVAAFKARYPSGTFSTAVEAYAVENENLGNTAQKASENMYRSLKRHADDLIALEYEYQLAGQPGNSASINSNSSSGSSNPLGSGSSKIKDQKAKEKKILTGGTTTKQSVTEQSSATSATNSSASNATNSAPGAPTSTAGVGFNFNFSNPLVKYGSIAIAAFVGWKMLNGGGDNA